jgi:hypothetical protein
MAVFVVLAEEPNEELAQKIATEFPADFYTLTDRQWLISADSIPQTVAEQLGVRSGKFGRVIVIKASTSASGWHSKTVWEWLNQKAKIA